MRIVFPATSRGRFIVVLAIAGAVAALFAVFQTPEEKNTPAITPRLAPPATSAATETPIAASAASPSPSATSTAETVSPFPDILSWSGASRHTVGCWLEKAGHRDPRWNCSSVEPVRADPCADETAYMGPDVPAALAPLVNPIVNRVEVTWDSGRLQAYTIEAKPGVTADEVRDAFRLPNVAPAGIASLDVTECRPGTTCIVVKAFEPVECEGRQRD